jgi:uncharacterized protein YceK
MKDGWGKVLVAVVVALLSSGCASSLSEIRASETSHTLASNKAPQEIAKCIELKMRAKLPFTAFVVVLEEHTDNTYCVVITAPGYVYVVDIIVKPTDGGSVVEFRKQGWWSNKTEMIEIAERCAK